MKLFQTAGYVICLTVLFTSIDATDARGPGGGGGGRGGFGGGGGSMSRSNFSSGNHIDSDRISNEGHIDNERNYSGNGNRSEFDNRFNNDNHSIINNQPNIGNRSINGNQFNINKNNINVNRSNNGNWNHNDWNHNDWNHNDWNHNGWNHDNWYGHWNHPWPGRPVYWWSAGFAAGWAAATPWSWGYYPYYNPYYVVVDSPTYDYSQPIVVSAYRDTDANQPSNVNGEAEQSFNEARASFKSGDYQSALSQVDEAIEKIPNDPVLHEFRGLTLFALKRYQESAAAVYAVLSIGPGWDWKTLNSLYPSVEVYTQQLRDLEQYTKEHPATAENHFLLGYNYMTLGHNDAATKQFKEAVRLNPKDQLSAQLISSLTPPAAGGEQKSSAPSAPVKPVDALMLAGSWKTTRSDGSAISLDLKKDGKYNWKYIQNDKPQEFNGNYTVADNLLILKQNNNPVMVGQVTILSDGKFNFKMAGDNPNDPGLTFEK